MEKQGDNRRRVARVLVGNFWQNVLKRLVIFKLMLAKCNLSFRGSSEELSKDNKEGYYYDDRTPSELKVVEKFTTFIEVEDLFAFGLHKLVTNSIQQKGLDIKNCRGQGYDIKNPLAPFCCILGKDTLRRFLLLGVLGKQF